MIETHTKLLNPKEKEEEVVIVGIKNWSLQGCGWIGAWQAEGVNAIRPHPLPSFSLSLPLHHLALLSSDLVSISEKISLRGSDNGHEPLQVYFPPCRKVPMKGSVLLPRRIHRSPGIQFLRPSLATAQPWARYVVQEWHGCPLLGQARGMGAPWLGKQQRWLPSRTGAVPRRRMNCG